MTQISLNKTSSHSAIDILSVAQHKNTNTEKPIDISCQEKNPTINPNKNSGSKQVHVKNADNHLRTEVIQKMIHRFLTENKMSKEKLAETLEITVKSLNQLCSKKAPKALILKINLPLVKLYCKTKFW